jgi:hypothetical protein
MIPDGTETTGQVDAETASTIRVTNALLSSAQYAKGDNQEEI